MLDLVMHKFLNFPVVIEISETDEEISGVLVDFTMTFHGLGNLLLYTHWGWIIIRSWISIKTARSGV